MFPLRECQEFKCPDFSFLQNVTPAEKGPLPTEVNAEAGRRLNRDDARANPMTPRHCRSFSASDRLLMNDWNIFQIALQGRRHSP